MQDKRVLYRGRVAMFEEQCEELMKAIRDDWAAANARRTDVETAVQRVEVCCLLYLLLSFSSQFVMNSATISAGMFSVSAHVRTHALKGLASRPRVTPASSHA